MSISPKQPEEGVFKPSITSSISNSTKKITSEFFTRPSHYLFWLSFSAIMVGLYCGMTFPWQLYLSVGLLATFKIYENSKTN